MISQGNEMFMKIEELYLDTLRDTLTGKTYNDTLALPFYPLRRFLNFCLPNLSKSFRRFHLLEANIHFENCCIAV